MPTINYTKITPKQLKAHGDICYKAGIREVVGWLDPLGIIRKNTGKIRFVLDMDLWQAKLKEWGIDA